MKALASLILIALVACSPSDARQKDALAAGGTGPGSTQALLGDPCEQTYSEVSIPEAFPDIDLPPGATPIEPAGQAIELVRVDMTVDSSVKDVKRFFVGSLKEAGHHIMATDYEGFEAEVFFAMSDGRPGIVRILLGCDEGSIASVELFRRDA